MPDPEKIAAIQNLPVPKDVSTLRSVLGVASYYRQYIENFALLTAPWSHLLKKNVPFKWDQECQAAFETLKDRLTSPPFSNFPTSPSHLSLRRIGPNMP